MEHCLHCRHIFFFVAAVNISHPDPRLALGRHRKKKNGLLTRSSFASGLVLASPLQCHVHVWVLPGAVGVVVVALEPLQEVAFVCRSFLERNKQRSHGSFDVQ